MQKTIIRPISELSKRMADVETFVVEQDTPVHLTKNGSNHMVIMSSSHFEMMQAKIGMLENLLRSEAEIRQGKTLPAQVAFDELSSSRQRISGCGV